MGVHQIKMKLIGQLPGVTGLIMQYERGTGREKYTVTIAGKNHAVTVEPQSTDEQIIAAILDGVKQPEVTTNGAPE